MDILNKLPKSFLKIMQNHNLIIPAPLENDLNNHFQHHNTEQELNMTNKSSTIEKDLINKKQEINNKADSLKQQSLDIREQLIYIRELQFELKVSKQNLSNHLIFKSISTIEQLQTFMKWHVFAVWDFMSLIKRLQNDLTCTSLPWMPSKYPQAARLVNEIVLGEETDSLPNKNGHTSHFEIYLSAMKEVNCDTLQIDNFIRLMQCGIDYRDALQKVKAPQGVIEFVTYTIETSKNASTHAVMGSFFNGRENVIPDMFTNILNHWKVDLTQTPLFVYYLKRHIEVDSGEHGPAAEKLIDLVTQNDPKAMIDLLKCSIESVNKRIKLWDDLLVNL